MLIEHFLCDDVGGKRNMCGMTILYIFLIIPDSMTIIIE